MNYIPLNIKTHYELLSSLIKIDDLIAFALKTDTKALGITDNNMFGCMEFLNACKNNGIKPIIGIDLKINDLSMIIYAKNYTSELTIEDIKTRNKNLICTTKDYKNYLDYKELFESVYLSYTTNEEKKEALITSDKVVYIKESLYIDSEDLEYLIYLSMIKDGKTI